MDFHNFSIPIGKCKDFLQPSTKNVKFQYFFSGYTLKEACSSNSSGEHWLFLAIEMLHH